MPKHLPKTLKAVLFDVDGTLVDSNDLHAAAWQEAFAHFGHSVPFERVRAQIGKGGDNLIPALLPDLSARERKPIETYRSDLFLRDYLARVTPFPGGRRLFERLKRGGKTIVLASSAGGAEIEHYVGLLDVGDLISELTSKDDVERSKPCPDIFEAALGQADGAKAAEAVVIGDSPFDVKAATKAGIATVAVRSGGFPEPELREAGAVALFDGPEDLLERYSEWAG